MNMKAKDIIDLLADKHASDLFVAECKTGATYTGTGMRMDAWAMKKTYSPPTTIGYEVKVSRGDFVNDNKWPEYLKGCHQFYFVSPRNVIDPEEVPEQCGLLYVAKTGTRLFTKKKAPWRDIGWPVDVMAYVLMTRAKIVQSYFNGMVQDVDQEGYWRRWLGNKESRKTLGHTVRGRIADTARKIGHENEELRRQMEAYDEIRERIKELGFDTSKPVSEWQVRNKLDGLSGEIPEGLARSLRYEAKSLERIADSVDELRAEAP